VAERLQVALDFHMSVSDQSVAHLNLLHDNTFKQPWLAAKLIFTAKALAKSSTAALVKHMVTTRPGNRTPFENHMFTHGEVWENLEDSSKAEPPVFLWGIQDRYVSLFMLLAPRLCCSDHVLAAERIDDRWPWVCTITLAMRIMTLNTSFLRLQHHLGNNQTFPITRGPLATLAC